MALVSFGPRVLVHHERFGVRKTNLNRLIVLHTSEGGEGHDRAEQLASFLAMPATRDASGKIINQASYGYIIDTDRVLPAVADEFVSYSAPGANHDGIHVCFPGRINQGRAGWLDEVSSAGIDRCVELMHHLSERHGIPLDRLDVQQVRAGQRGYCDHGTISAAYGRTDHTDVGPDFPWDVLAARLNPPEDDMANPTKYIRVVVPGDATRSEALVVMMVQGLDDPVERDCVTGFFDASTFEATAAQYDALLAIYGA